MKKLVWVFILLMSMSLEARELFKCTANGAVVYQNGPCKGEAAQDVLKQKKADIELNKTDNPSLKSSTIDQEYDELDSQLDELEITMAKVRAGGDQQLINEAEILRAQKIAAIHKIQALKKIEKKHLDAAKKADIDIADHKRRTESLVRELTNK